MERISLKINTKKGQMRVVEVILASFIIVFALSFANILAIAPQSPKYEATELEKMGYNVLYDLDKQTERMLVSKVEQYSANHQNCYYYKQGLLVRLVYNEDWYGLRRALLVLLPIDVYFNLTVYNLNGTRVNDIPIFYGNASIFVESKNVASITYGLTGNLTTNERVYDPRILVLQLSRG